MNTKLKVYFDHISHNPKKALPAWQEIHGLKRTFEINKSNLGYKYSYSIKLNCENIIDCLENWKINQEKTCYLELEVKYSDTHGLKYIPIIPLEIFLQDLFLAISLSNPGALNLAPSKIVSDTGKESNILFLYADIVEVALDFCRQWGWPRFEKIKFEQAWDWLKLLKYPNTAVADSPASKACSAIIGLAGSPWLGPFELLSTSIVLESLLTNNNSGVSGQIKERLKKIIGEPKKDKKWITTYYELRSKVIHGSAHMPRPHINIDFDEDGEQLYLYYATYVYRAIGIIIALLQKLIKNRSERFSFSEKVSYRKFEK